MLLHSSLARYMISLHIAHCIHVIKKHMQFKVTGYLELYDFIYVYIYATKTGILKFLPMKPGPHKYHT